VTIDILPEDVLLEIFDHYVDPTRKYDGLETWCTLVHVCQKWRNIVFESPLRLNLRIHCHPTTPLREKLDIWPALPIALEQYDDDWQPKSGVDNVAAALEQNNRICQISLSGVPTSQMGEILAAMHKPFPVLTDLWLESDDETVSVDPDLSLGGPAPCLRFL
jgi:F-box-like